MGVLRLKAGRGQRLLRSPLQPGIGEIVGHTDASPSAHHGPDDHRRIRRGDVLMDGVIGEAGQPLLQAEEQDLRLLSPGEGKNPPEHLPNGFLSQHFSPWDFTTKMRREINN